MNEVEKYHETLRRYRESGTKVIDEKTERIYAYFIEDFVKFIGEDELHDLIKRSSIEERRLLPRAIDEWLMSKTKWNYSTKVIAGFAVLHYLNWVYDFDYTNKAVKHLAGRGRERVFRPNIFSDEELYKLFNAAEKMFQFYPNLTVGIFVGWECLTRSGELVRIRLDDIEDDGWITIRGLKGSHTNKIKVSEKTWNYIISVLPDRKEYLLEKGGKPYTPEGWQAKFNRFCRKVLGSDKNYRWHDFARHTRITKLFDEGYSMDDIQALARHKRRESTEVYRHLIEVKKRFL